MHLVMLYIILKIKGMSMTFSGCGAIMHTLFSKTKQVACYNKIHFKGNKLL